MDTSQDSTQSLASFVLTEKQQKLIAQFDNILKANGINYVINVVPDGAFSKSTVALDIEHDEHGEFVGCGILDINSDTVHYFTDLSLLRSVDLRSVSVIAHNGVTDIEMLQQWGVDISQDQLVHDTMLYAHVLDSSRKGFGLKHLAKEDLGFKYPSYDDIVGRRTLKQKTPRVTLDQQPVELTTPYNACDCWATKGLFKVQKSSISTAHSKVYEIERELAPILLSMSNRGVCVDLPYLSGLKDALEAQRRPLEEAITNELGPVNLNSPRKLLEALNAKGIKPQLKGKPSTDKRALEKYKDRKVVSDLLAYSEIDTLLSSFVYPYLERNQAVVHPFFNQCGTRTGRLSCSKPNLLQIPARTENGKMVRRMFIPRPGMRFGDCDFGQVEPRLMAHLSKDPTLCGMFNQGIDFHTFTAERLAIDRTRAKVLNLSVGYRATRFSVQRQLGGSLNEAQQEIDKWWNMFPDLHRWQDRLLFDAKKSGFCTTLFGRRIKVDRLNETNPFKREAAERQLINNIVQGSAAEVMKAAMILINNCGNEKFSNSFGLLVQVYDELLAESFNMEEDSKQMKWCMENCVKLDVPLTVDVGIGPNWADCK